MADTATMDYPEAFNAPSVEDTERLLESLEDKGYDVERLSQQLETAEGKSRLARDVDEQMPGVNGNLDSLVKHVELYEKESAKKQEWSGWEKVKETGGRAWEWAKRNKWYIGAAVLIGVLGIAAYYTGAGATAVDYVRDKATQIMAKYGMGSAQAAAGEMATQATEAASAAAGNAPEAINAAKDAAAGVLENVAPAVPTTPPMPTAIPSVEDALKGLDALEKAG